MNFIEERKKLNEEIEYMGKLVRTAMEQGVMAFKNHDLTLARKIAENDIIVNDAERKAHLTALRLLKSDLSEDEIRLITTSLKVLTDMERIADQIADIAEILSFYEKSRMKFDLTQIIQMLEESIYMVDGAISCFINLDLGTASRIIKTDDKVDWLFSEVRRNVIESLFRDRALADEAIDIIMISKYIEKIADHATTIGEWTIFAQTGKAYKK